MRSRSLTHAAAGLLVAAGVVGCSRSAPPPPNLLLITTDALDAASLECLGGPAGAGATLCSLATRGTLGTAWGGNASGEPGLAASVASLLTSLPAEQHGVSESAASFLPSRVDTLAEVLRRVGYDTGAVVASPQLNRSRNLQQGFDRYRNRRVDTPLPLSTHDWVTDTALRWTLEVRPPWFLWVHYPSELAPLDRAVAKLLSRLDVGPAPPAVLVTAALAVRGERVPVLWRAADRLPSAEIQLVGSPLDAAPSLLRAAGVAAPASFAGRPRIFEPRLSAAGP